MKSKIEIINTLPYFTGTVDYHIHRFSNQQLILTDGANFIRQACDAYWLFDIITQQAMKQKEFVATLKQKSNNSWIFKTADLNNRLFYKQTIPFSDFPLKKIKLFYMNEICYLPSEH